MPAFTAETASLYGSRPRQSFKRAYRQALKIQAVLLDKITAEDVKLSEASQASRAWVELHDLQRRLLGLGDPKSVPAANDPSQEKPKRKRGQASQSEPATPDGPA